jgi:protocatechuate 3,4-dioxygenase beta subunit
MISMVLSSKILTVYSNDASAPLYKIRGTILGQDGNPKPSKIAILREAGDTGGHRWPPGYEHAGAIRTDDQGQYEINHLWPKRYTLIAYDSAGEFDPAIKGGLIPEPME